MTEPQVRGTDRNEAAANLRAWLRRYAEEMPATARSAEMTLDDALDWERRRTVEPLARLIVRADDSHPGEGYPPFEDDWIEIVDRARAALSPATPGKKGQHE